MKDIDCKTEKSALNFNVNATKLPSYIEFGFINCDLFLFGKLCDISSNVNKLRERFDITLFRYIFMLMIGKMIITIYIISIYKLYDKYIEAI